MVEHMAPGHVMDNIDLEGDSHQGATCTYREEGQPMLLQTLGVPSSRYQQFPGESEASNTNLIVQGRIKVIMHISRKQCTLSRARLIGIFVCATLSIGLVVARLSHEGRINVNHDLVDNDSVLVSKLSPKSFSTLMDLPAQGPHFLENMQHLSFYVEGGVVQYTISGFRRANTSYFELETRGGHDVIIAAGKAFVRETSTGKIVHMITPAAEPECGIPPSLHAPKLTRSHSWPGIVTRYQVETANQTGAKKWRHPAEGNADPMHDLYEWFGALVSSGAAQETAEKSAAAAREAALCEYDTRGLECAAYATASSPQAPKLSTQGLNKLLLLASDGLWLLYLDFSDWTQDVGVAKTQRRVRSKLASGVTLDPAMLTGTEIRVTENLGSSMFTYQMMHPAVLPSMYNMSNVSIMDQGLALAEEVLESAAYDLHKGDCRDEDMHDEEEQAVVAANVGFNCEDGTFTWSVAGWRVRAAADGSLKTLEFANTPTNDGMGDSEVEVLSFRVLSVIDASNEQGNYLLRQRFQNGDIFRGCEDQVQRPLIDGSRRLAQKNTSGHFVLAGTNWCGVGQCGTDKEGCRHNYCLDHFDGDWACRKHDACAKSSKLRGITVNACSCDRDLVENRGTGHIAALIESAFGDNGVWPCISHERTCRKWGWVRKGWVSYWGVTGHSTCEDWNYIGKFADPRLQEFGYSPQIKGFSVDSRTNWSRCVDNTEDPELVDLLPGIPWK